MGHAWVEDILANTESVEVLERKAVARRIKGGIHGSWSSVSPGCEMMQLRSLLIEVKLESTVNLAIRELDVHRPSLADSHGESRRYTVYQAPPKRLAVTTGKSNSSTGSSPL